MIGGRIRRKLKLIYLYTYSCLRHNSGKPQHPHALQSLGFSHVVYCNQPRLHPKGPVRYPSNSVSTTRYNIITFLPKAIFEQFRRVANLYFLMVTILSLTPTAPFSVVSMIAPLAFVVGLSMAKEALEDWRRFMQDVKVNGQKVGVYKKDGVFSFRLWQKLRVGDVVKVEKDVLWINDHWMLQLLAKLCFCLY